jgi:hypothetical protein
MRRHRRYSGLCTRRSKVLDNTSRARSKIVQFCQVRMSPSGRKRALNPFVPQQLERLFLVQADTQDFMLRWQVKHQADHGPTRNHRLPC